MRILELYTSENIYEPISHSISTNYILISCWNFLVSHGFFMQMRLLFDKRVPELYESSSKPPTPLAASLLDLTLRSLRLNPINDEFVRTTIIKHFFNDLLYGPFSSQIKRFVIPSIVNDVPINLRADYIFMYLSKNLSLEFSDKIFIKSSQHIWLLYSLVTLINNQITQMNNADVVNYLHILRYLSSSLVSDNNSVHSELNEEDDENNDAMDLTENDGQDQTDAASVINEILTILNEATHVQTIVSLIDSDFINDSETIISLSCVCHSLLACHQLAVNQFR